MIRKENANFCCQFTTAENYKRRRQHHSSLASRSGHEQKTATVEHSPMLTEISAGTSFRMPQQRPIMWDYLNPDVFIRQTIRLCKSPIGKQSAPVKPRWIRIWCGVQII